MELWRSDFATIRLGPDPANRSYSPVTPPPNIKKLYLVRPDARACANHAGDGLIGVGFARPNSEVKEAAK